MDAHQIVWNEKAAKDIINHLTKRRMEGSYAATADQARKEILSMIPKGAVVFRCGSMPAGGMGVWEAIPKLPGVTLIALVVNRALGDFGSVRDEARCRPVIADGRGAPSGGSVDMFPSRAVSLQLCRLRLLRDRAYPSIRSPGQRQCGR